MLSYLYGDTVGSDVRKDVTLRGNTLKGVSPDENMQINFLDNLLEDEETESSTESFHGSLYPGEVLQFNYENEKLIDVNYVRKDIF